jgi:tRNA G10  N-methylase Trm11
MAQSLCVLGRQPALGLAELESLYGTKNIRPIGAQAALLNIDPPQIDFSRLGGTVKFCKLLTILDTTIWKDIQQFLINAVPEHAKMLPNGKLTIGLSAYGLQVTSQQLNAAGLNLKKVLKHDRPVRIVPNTETFLNSAQVLHNKLTHQLGWELIFVRDGHRTIVAQNIAEQDIAAYAQRDQARPKRDARIGMLPPKLAQIIVNLAVGKAEPVDPACGPHDPKHKTILDPFCGTGVIPQEALLMGYDVYGTDNEPRMIDYSQTNLEWLVKNFKLQKLAFRLDAGDATNYRWDKFDVVASETYLGRPFSALPKPDVLETIAQDVNTILKKFLQNLAKQTKPGFRLCLAVPAWSLSSNSSLSTPHSPLKFRHLPILDQLTDMGYTRLSFVHAKQNDLIYHREGQIVGRELVVLKRI